KRAAPRKGPFQVPLIGIAEHKTVHRFDEFDRTESSFANEPPHKSIHRLVLNAITDHQLHICFCAGVDHLLAFGRADFHRLLAEHMFASLGSDKKSNFSKQSSLRQSYADKVPRGCSNDSN